MEDRKDPKQRANTGSRADEVHETKCCPYPRRVVCANVVSALSVIAIISLGGALLYLCSAMLQTYEYHLLIVERKDVDVAMNMITAFLVVMLISLVFEASTWFAKHPSQLCYKIVILARIFSMILCVIFFVLYCVRMMNFEDEAVMRKAMKDSLDEYTNDYLTPPRTIAWNKLQMEYQGCGVDGPRDWQASRWYTQNPVKRVFPVTCCEGIDRYYSIRMIKYGDWPCKYYPVAHMRGGQAALVFIHACYGLDGSNVTRSFQNGIFTAAHKDLVDNMTNNYVIIGIVVSILVLQLVLLAMTCCVCRFYRKKEKAEKEAHYRKALEEAQAKAEANET